MSWFWGGSVKEGPEDPPVPEGHRGIDVLIEGQVIRVDVDALAEVSGLFLQIQSTTASTCPLEDFPGGVTTFRQIVHLKTPPNPEAPPPLQVTEDTVLNLLEAAYLLECPQVFEEVMETAYMRNLTSRRAVELLEHILPFTMVSSPIDGSAVSPMDSSVLQRPVASGDSNSNGGRTFRQAEDFLRTFQLETSMWQNTERAALELVQQVDTSDFVLGPRLATGSLRVCCELLRQHKKRAEEAGYMSSALQPMNSLWKYFADKPLRAKVAWDSHLFALQCMRKRLPLEGMEALGSLALKGEQEEDDEARDDLPSEICEVVSDQALLDLVELVGYVDMRQAPPTWTALLLRVLLLSDQQEKARAAFVEMFPNSRALQRLACRKPVVVPVLWLSEVAAHAEATEVVMRVLARFREMSGEEFCKLMEDVVVPSFIPSPHCATTLLTSSLLDDLVGACFDAGRKAKTARRRGSQIDESRARCPKHWAGAHVLWRLQHIGTRLFAAAFIAQHGFLPHPWPDAPAKTPQASADDGNREASAQNGVAAICAAASEEATCLAEPLVVRVAGHCLWDEDLLELGLLHDTMDAGRKAPNKPILHYGRQVIMRHLWYRHQGTYCQVPVLRELWELACWPLCEDAGLIRQALEYLKGTFRGLQAYGGDWCHEHEESLFQMFVALDLSRLPGQALLSPWVPAQVQAVRLLLHGQSGEQNHQELQLGVTSAAEDLKSISQQCIKLTNRLNIVEQRTVINKSQINDAISAIEEHQRKKREPAPGGRRTQNLQPST